MFIQLKDKWLQHLLNKNQNQGLTEIEIIFIILIVGALAFIALPTFLNQSHAIKGSEAKDYIGAINRSQQAYFIEKKGFSNSINDLGVGIETKTKNYQYSTQSTGKAAFSYGIAQKGDQKSYVGGVFVVPATTSDSKAAKDEMTTRAILCVANTPGNSQPANPTIQKNQPACGSGTTKVR